MLCFGTDWIWERALNEFISAHAMLDAQGEILEGMANGVALGETAEGIALLVEKLVPAASCAIALVHRDGKHMKLLAAPSMPQSYFPTLDNIQIAPDGGSTGTAAWRREPVIVADTAVDPLWKNLQDFAAACGIRASWALPILHDDGTVLGVVTLYYQEPQEPQDWDWSALNSCIKLIRLALATERRERNLFASETRWRIGAEATGIGTFDADFETGAEVWSPTTRHILGVSATTQPSYAAFLDLIHPDDRTDFQTRLPEATLPPSGDRWCEEVRIRKADTGEERIVMSKGCVITGRDGRPRHAVGTLCDITDQRRHEQELEHARTEAEAANRAKSRFLASMSHELRTPLNAIIGFSDLIKNRVYGPVTPVRYEGYIEDIHKSGIHLLSLINDVLDMAKIEAQKFELRLAPFPLQGLAESALMLVRPQALAKGLHLELDIKAVDVTLYADERMMRQVLANLLTNAVKFTGSGGMVRLFGLRLDDGGLALGVEDNGVGMTEEGITTALEPFGQVQMDGTMDRSGTGLGLPLAKAMIESHGATFHIVSERGVGTRIWSEFPPSDVSAVRQTG